MRENTLNEDQTVEIVDAQISILTQQPYMVIKGALGERIIDIIAIENDNLLYPLFILPTTELVAGITSPETGEPLFRLHNAN